MVNEAFFPAIYLWLSIQLTNRIKDLAMLRLQINVLRRIRTRTKLKIARTKKNPLPEGKESI